MPAGPFLGKRPFPLKRTHLADALGLPKVHLMRALRVIREEGLLVLSRRILRVPSRRKLARFCGYPLVHSVSDYSIL